MLLENVFGLCEFADIPQEGLVSKLMIQGFLNIAYPKEPEDV